jgi:CubicO group peptidase (beta-lactamase class C family)
VAAGLHLGGQLYVTQHGKTVADLAFGESRPGTAVRADSLMQWLSATKPIAAVAIAQLWERGLLQLDDAVAKYIPECAANGKEHITLRHVLTHTGGFRSRVDLELGCTAWPEAIERVCAAKKERRWSPGRKAGYHVASGWYALGDVVRRLDGRPFAQYVREMIFGRKKERSYRAGRHGHVEGVPLALTALFARMNVDEIHHLDLAYAPPFGPVYDAIIGFCGKAILEL